MPTIIRKPNANTVALNSDAANNAVNQINNNKALTVTSKRVPMEIINRASTAATISAVPNVLTAINRTASPQSKSPTPISLSRPQLSTSNNKTSINKTKPNILSSRNTNAVKLIPNSVKAADPPSISVIPRTVSSNSIPEVLVSTKTQSKALNKSPAKPSSISIEKIPPTTAQRTSPNVGVHSKILQTNKPVSLSKKANTALSINTDKRANNILSNSPAKRPRLALNNAPVVTVSIDYFYSFNFTCFTILLNFFLNCRMYDRLEDRNQKIHWKMCGLVVHQIQKQALKVS